MQLTPIANENTGTGLTESLRERLRRETERESAALVKGDTISISDQAREMLSAASAEKAAGEEQDDRMEDAAQSEEQNWQEVVQAQKRQEQGLGGDLTFVDPAASGGSVQAKTVDEEKIAALRKQIQEVQRQLNKEQQNLQKAQAQQQAEPAQADPDAPAQGEDLPELEAAKGKVGQLTDQLLQLNQQLQEALGQGGGSGGGQIQGTRAGSGGVGRIIAHIGEANDPYAAAAATEAAEMGASEPLSF